MPRRRSQASSTRLQAQNAELMKRLGEAGAGPWPEILNARNIATVLEIAEERCRKRSASSLPTHYARIKTPIHGCCCRFLIAAGACWLPSVGRLGNRGSSLTREHITETVAGQADYALPEGFTRAHHRFGLGSFDLPRSARPAHSAAVAALGGRLD